MEDTDAKLFGEGRSTDQKYAVGKLSATEQGVEISFTVRLQRYTASCGATVMVVFN